MTIRIRTDKFNVTSTVLRTLVIELYGREMGISHSYRGRTKLYSMNDGQSWHTARDLAQRLINALAKVRGEDVEVDFHSWNGTWSLTS